MALRIIDDTARWLGIGVTTLVHTIDPGSVVLGGAMNFGGDGCVIGQRFLAGIREEFRRRTFPNVFAGTSLSVCLARLGRRLPRRGRVRRPRPSATNLFVAHRVPPGCGASPEPKPGDLGDTTT